MNAPAAILTLLADGGLADPQTLVLIGLVLVIGTLFLRRARTRRKGSTVDGRAAAQARVHNSRLATQAREDINELMIRLEELSREICGQIDTRFAKLEHAILEADAILAALRAASDAPAAAAAESAAPTDPKHVEVCRRAQQGQTELVIARDMGMPIGEVELILSLQRSRQSAAPAVASAPPTTNSDEDERERPKGMQLDEQA